VRATLDGEAYHRRCLAILAEVEEADAVFTDWITRRLASL